MSNVIKINYSKDKIIIYAKYDKNFIDNVKNIPNANFQRTTKSWIIPFNEFLSRRDTLFKDFKIDISEKDMNEAMNKELERLKRVDRVIFNEIDKRFEFKFKYNTQVVQDIRSFAEWDKDKRTWYSNVKNRKLVENYIDNSHFIKLYDDKIVNKILRQIKKEEKLLEASNATNANIVINNINPAFELMGYQKAGVAYASQSKKGVMIADEMGLGKTIQGIATVAHKKAFPTVVIVPASLKINWKKEFEKWVPGIDVNVVDKKKSSHSFNHQVVVINYDIVGKFFKELKRAKFKSMIVDESHYLKNPDAKRTQYVLQLAKSIKTKILLSGTPMLNRPVELASQLDIMGVLDDLFGGYDAYKERYCNPKLIRIGKKRVWDFNGASNLKELNKILRANCYIRREKKDVLKDLPKKTVSAVYMELDDESKKEYKKAIEDLGKWAAEQLLSKPEFIEELNEKFPPNSNYNEQDKIDYIKKAMKRKEIITNQNESLLRVSALRQISAKGKMKSIKEWVKNVLDTDEKLVLFGVHRKFIDELFKEFEEYNPVIVTGDTPNSDRDKAVEMFQYDESCRLFIGSIKAAGVGLTLTRANQLACFEFEWRPGDMDQMEARVDRYGQTRPVNIWYLMTPDGIDIEMYKMLKKKGNIVHKGIVGSDRIDVNMLLNNVIHNSIDTKEKENLDNDITL